MDGDLDKSDKDLLKDIQAFNRAYANKGWHIRDKVVTEDLSHIVLVHSSMTSVQLLNVNWRSANVVETEFTNVEFEQSQFTEARFQGVVFKDCRFILCSLAKATLTDCRIINCTCEELNARDAVFESCLFQSSVDTGGIYGSASLHNCRYEQCKLENNSFYSTKLNAVSLVQTALKATIFASIQGTGLSFESAVLHNCSFEGDGYGHLTFQGGNTRGVTFKSFNSQSLTLQNCTKIERLSVWESVWIGAVILDCPDISELTINQSNLKNFTLARNQIAYFEMEETSVSGDSHITDCAISGLNLERSTLIGLKMTNCTLANYLMANGATLDAVRLERLVYAPRLEISTDSVKYRNGSDAFRLR